MRTCGLNEIFRTLLYNGNKGISNQELIRLLQKIENDATEIYHVKYGLDDKIMFNIESRNTANSNLIDRQSVKSLECIRQSIKKNLDLMNGDGEGFLDNKLDQLRMLDRRFLCLDHRLNVVSVVGNHIGIHMAKEITQEELREQGGVIFQPGNFSTHCIFNLA
ncbi:MAG: hypothetical protein WA364_14050 [Candidatus Nitrosopolaris sp.]